MARPAVLVGVIVASLLSPIGDVARSAVDAECDFNGDGYSDLVIQLPGFDLPKKRDAGAVLIAEGSALGPVMTEARRVTQRSVAGARPQRADHFGQAIACGDLDSDGYDELVVGSPGEGGARGRVDVIPGSAAGVRPKQAFRLSSGPLPPGARFGAAVDVGHFRPGGEWPVVGAPGYRDGLVFVFSDLDQVGVRLSGTLGAAEFGSALAAGDIDGDGWDDLAVGAPGEGHGAVDLRIGMTARGATSSWTTISPPGGKPGNRFGHALAVIGSDGSAPATLIVSDPRRGAGAGAVSEIAINERGEVLATKLYGPGQLGVSGDKPSFGASLAVVDTAGNGTPEVVVGMPQMTVDGRPDAGGVALLSTAMVVTQRTDGVRGAAQKFSGFGWRLNVGDFNGDGGEDLVVYTPGDRRKGRQLGRVQVFESAGSSLLPVRGATATSRLSGSTQTEAMVPWNTVAPRLGWQAGTTAAVKAHTNHPEIDPPRPQSPYVAMMRLIKRADPGSRILIAVFRVDTGGPLMADMYAELLRAKEERNVEVRISVDDNVDPQFISDVRAMGFDLSLCHGNCLGEVAGAQHQKFLVFSSVDRHAVTVVATGNLIETAMGDAYETAVVIREFDVDNAPIHDAFRGRFYGFEDGDLAVETLARTATHGTVRVQFLPLAVADPVADSLALVHDGSLGAGKQRCRHERGDGSIATTTVRMALSRADAERPAIANELVRLHRSGCIVQVYSGTAGQELLQLLESMGFPVNHDGGGDFHASGAWCIDRQHAKSMTVRGLYAGRVVELGWTGSHNLDLASLRQASENWLEIQNKKVVATLDRHMDEMLDLVEPCA